MWVLCGGDKEGDPRSSIDIPFFAGGLLPDALDSNSNGMGSFVDETRISDGQGAVLSTENITDMALIGNGFFAIQNLIDNSVSFTLEMAPLVSMRMAFLQLEITIVFLGLLLLMALLPLQPVVLIPFFLSKFPLSETMSSCLN